MKKVLFLFALALFVSPSFADETVVGGEAIYPENGEVEPLTVRLSDEEKQLENSTDIDFIENETKLKDLPCNDKDLIAQVREFISQNTTSRNLRSVADKRARILMLKNLHEFEEIKDTDIKDNFETSAALVNLRVNEGRYINHICVSKGNISKKFSDIYILIYQDLNRYKVTVTNLMKTPSSTDEATFVYNGRK